MFRSTLDFLSYPFRILLSAPVGAISASRRLKQLSAPAIAALVVAMFMLLLAVVWVVAWSFENPRSPFATTQFLLLIGLSVVTPPVVYWAVRLWLEGRGSRFPDIDWAWRQGMAALEKEGFSPADSPLFLVLGIRNEYQARAMMRSAGLTFAVQGVPEGANPIYFYAVRDFPLNNERWNPIFIVCVDASQASRLCALASDAGRERLARQSIDDTVRSHDMRGTLVHAGNDPPAAGSPMRGTVVSGAASDPAPAQPAGTGRLAGTIVAGQSARTTSGSSQAAEPLATLDKRDASQQAARLQHLCDLIVRSREPFCPLNGILVVTPAALLRRSSEQTRQLAYATRNDLSVIQQHAMLRCPVVSLVGGMEHAPGFGELVRRVGAARAMDQRLGMGFEPWNPPTQERLSALAAHICGAIEDIVYGLFREQDGYNKPGNGKLYLMLCRARGEFADTLREFLTHAFAQQEGAQGSRTMLFAGCYFAATGEIDRLQGFLKGVLADKLLDKQDDLAWTDDAMRRDAVNEGWARFGMLVTGLLIVALAAAAIYKFRS